MTKAEFVKMIFQTPCEKMPDICILQNVCCNNLLPSCEEVL